VQKQRAGAPAGADAASELPSRDLPEDRFEFSPL
jgi:hypothetical protein